MEAKGELETASGISELTHIANTIIELASPKEVETGNELMIHEDRIERMNMNGAQNVYNAVLEKLNAKGFNRIKIRDLEYPVIIQAASGTSVTFSPELHSSIADRIIVDTPEYQLVFCGANLDPFQEPIRVELKNVGISTNTEIDIRIMSDELAGFLTLVLPTDSKADNACFAYRDVQQETGKTVFHGTPFSYNKYTDRMEGFVSESRIYFVADGENISSSHGKVSELIDSNLEGISLYAREAIISLAEQGIVEGNSNGQINPTQLITRNAFVKMLMLFIPYVNTKLELSFPDIPVNSPFRDYINSAHFRSYVAGYTENTFAGAEPINRQQACLILSRVLEKKNDLENVVKDEEINAIWKTYESFLYDCPTDTPNGLLFRKAVARMIKLEIVPIDEMDGYSFIEDGLFEGKQPITREEVMYMIYQMDHYIH